MLLSDVAHVFAGRPSTRLKPADETAVYRLVSPRHVTRRLAPVGDLEAAGLPKGEEVSRLQLEEGDVVLTSRGKEVRAAVADAEHVGAVIGANLIVARLSGGMDPALLAAYLRHPIVAQTLLAEFAGSTISGFTVDSLRRLELRSLPLPDAELLGELVTRSERHADLLRRAADARLQAVEEAVYERLSPELSAVT